MIFIKFHILLTGLFCTIGAVAQNSNDSVFRKKTMYSFSVTNALNNKKELLKTGSKELRLFIFLSPECPLCKRYSPLLKKLYNQFQERVDFYGVVPGKAYSTQDVRQYQHENNIAFSLLIDEDKKLSNYLQASATPEVILLNSNCEMVYKGAIDNLLVKLGKQRTKATEDFLYNAIVQSLDGEKVLVKRTKAVGCRINDY